MRSRKNSGMTLRELVMIAAILVALITAAGMYVAGYVSTARQMSDKRTLTTLNDALQRYRLHGGSVEAFTSGTPLSNVMSRLTSVMTMSNKGMSAVNASFTVPARSIAVLGDRKTYRFTRYHTYTEEAGGSTPTEPSATPTYVGVVQTGSASNANPSIITLTTGVAAGSRLVMTNTNSVGTAYIPTAINDSRGNSWTIESVRMNSINRGCLISSAHITTALQVGDTISITFPTTQTVMGFQLHRLTGVSASGQPMNTLSTGVTTDVTSATITGPATNAPAVLVGAIKGNFQDGVAITGANKLAESFATNDGWATFYNDVTVSGTQSITFTFNSLRKYNMVWSIYR